MIVLQNRAGVRTLAWRGSLMSLVLSFLPYPLIASMFLAPLITPIDTPFFLFSLIGLQAARLCNQNLNSSLNISTGIAFLLLYAVFAPNLYIFQGIDSSVTIAMFIIFTDVIKWFDAADRGQFLGTRRSASLQWAGLVGAAFLVAVLPLAVPNPSLSLMVPLGVGICFQEQIMRRRRSKRQAILALLALEGAIAVYMVWHWTGFGRLAVASYMLMPFMLYSMYFDSRLKLWHFMIALPALVIWAVTLRGGRVSDLTQVAAVGVTDHIRLTDYLRNGLIPNDAGLITFLEQFSLFFLNWFPRSVWASKPVGAGYYSVDWFWGRQGYGEEHSVSLGFVGDQIFALGNSYLLGLAVLLLTIVLTRHVLTKFFGRHTLAAVVVFDATLLTYFWGGMAAFGSRAWFMILPIFLVTLYGKLRFRRADTFNAPLSRSR